MNPLPPDPLRRILGDLDSSIGRVAMDVDALRAQLRALEAELGRRPAPGPASFAAPGPAAAQRPGSPPPPTRGPASPWATALPVGPAPQFPVPQRPPGAPPMSPPFVPQPARRRSTLSVATVLAALGGVILLLGVVFLLVLAAQAGYFGPLARVVAAAVLAVGLVVGGIVLQRRATGERATNPGALALVGTGVAAGILDVVACTSLYEWIPPLVGFALTGLLGAGAMLLARWWRSDLLAALTAAGVMLLAPLIATDVTLPCFVVIVAVVTSVICLDRGDVVRWIRSALPALFLGGYLLHSIVTGDDQVILVVVAILSALVSAGVAWVETVLRPDVHHRGLALVPAAVPLLGLSGVTAFAPVWPVLAVLAAGYLAGSVVAGRSADGRGGHAVLSGALGTVGSVLAATAATRLGSLDVVCVAVGVLAAAYAVAAGLLRRGWLDVIAVCGALLSVFLYLAAADPMRALSERYGDILDLVVAAQSLVLAILAVAVTWWGLRRQTDGGRQVLLVSGAVIALAAVSVAIVAVGVAVGGASGDAESGFRGAHLVVTTLWIALAAWLVLARRARIPEARRVGFVLGGLALVKLFLLDLSTLPGILRVVAFLVVGGVLLAVAVRYTGDGAPSSGPQPQGPDGQGPPSYRPADHRPGPDGAPSYGPGPYGPSADRTPTYGPDPGGPRG